jgi:hypothetical protein
MEEEDGHKCIVQLVGPLLQLVATWRRHFLTRFAGWATVIPHIGRIFLALCSTTTGRNNGEYESQTE